MAESDAQTVMSSRHHFVAFGDDFSPWQVGGCIVSLLTRNLRCAMRAARVVQRLLSANESQVQCPRGIVSLNANDCSRELEEGYQCEGVFRALDAYQLRSIASV